jgi:arsenate reductase (thioredoxin)
MTKKPKVLFLSTGNATRSQMAEGFLRTLAADRFDAASAATGPADVSPLTREVMAEDGVDISWQRSRTISDSFKDYFGYVITFYDDTKERSPVFPFAINLLRWSLADPSSARGSAEEKKQTFRRARDLIKSKVREFVQHVAEKDRQQQALALKSGPGQAA